MKSRYAYVLSLLCIIFLSIILMTQTLPCIPGIAWMFFALLVLCGVMPLVIGGFPTKDQKSGGSLVVFFHVLYTCCRINFEVDSDKKSSDVLKMLELQDEWFFALIALVWIFCRSPVVSPRRGSIVWSHVYRTAVPLYGATIGHQWVLRADDQ